MHLQRPVKRFILPTLPILPLVVSVSACGDDGDPAIEEGTGTGTDPTGSETPGGSTGVADESGDSGTAADTTGEEQSGIPVLGDLGHTLDDVVVDVIATGLETPTDAEFNPDAPEELWVLNRNSSVMIVSNPGEANQEELMRIGTTFNNGTHFLAKPAALAFGAPGYMATAQQEDQITQPSTPADFMGPTLWTSDSAIFDAGHPSHLDMLHNSPLASGIAWEQGNVYWVYDGTHGSLTRYNFNEDHDLGGTDHTDGELQRYADGQLGYQPGVVHHVVVHHEAALVYATDPANNRVVALDPSVGAPGGAIAPNYDGTTQTMIDGSAVETLIDGSTLEADMAMPSGLEMDDGYLFVTDSATSVIFGFDFEGNLVDWLDTGWPAGTLMGIAFDDEGRLYAVDAVNNQLVRISPAE